MTKPKKPSKRLSMADIARMAGTSKSTVSRVLSRTGQTSPETEARVRKVVRETGFVPDTTHTATRSKPGQNANLSVVFLMLKRRIPDYWAPVYHAIVETAQDLGANLFTQVVVKEDLSSGLLRKRIQTARSAGTLLLPVEFDYEIERPLDDLGPVVLFGRRSQHDTHCPFVGPDNWAGMEAIADHLASLGHKRIRFVWAYKRTQYVEEREAMMRACVEQRGMTMDTGRLRVHHDTGIEGFLPDAGTPGRPTAVVVYNDFCAMQAIQRLEAAGLNVPNDISVVGFDGYQADQNDRLTTWAVDQRLMGAVAVRTLLARIEGAPVPLQSLIGGGLLVKESTAQPPTGENSQTGPSALR